MPTIEDTKEAISPDGSAYSMSYHLSTTNDGQTTIKSHHVVIFVLFILALVLFHFRHKLAALHDRYRMNKRVRYNQINGGGSFEDDLEAGLSSNNFDIASNISNSDSRKGLLEQAKLEIKEMMAAESISFDDARLKYLQQQLGENNVGPDGMPLDPKTVSFSGKT